MRVTPQRWQLIQWHRKNPEATVTASVVAGVLGCEAGTASDLLNRLVAIGHAEKLPDKYPRQYVLKFPAKPTDT